MPSSTLRSEARGRPPRRREPGRGSKGRIFSHWASVNRRPYRAIGPPAALLTLFISHFRQPNYLRIQALHPVLKQLLGSGLRNSNIAGGTSLACRPSFFERAKKARNCDMKRVRGGSKDETEAARRVVPHLVLGLSGLDARESPRSKKVPRSEDAGERRSSPHRGQARTTRAGRHAGSAQRENL